MLPESRSRVLRLATLLLAFLFPCMSAAQTSNTGMLMGIVTDPGNAAVPGATLRLTQSATNFTRTIGSDSSGHYYFPLLPPGTYKLQVSRPGFATLEETDVSVRVSEKTELNIRLNLATFSSVVSVKAQPSLVQAASSTLGRLVSNRQVANLPLATRNYTQILALSPGVEANVANAGALGRNSLEISDQGARLSDNNVQINGADANNPFTTNLSDGGGGQGIAVPAPDSIQEFKVQTGLYDAATGRNGGANINVVTKSGTNDFHGNVYEFFRNDVLNANSFFFNRAGQSRPRLRQNQFGFTFGGPIQRDKTLFFVSYEGNRQSNGVTAGSTSTVFLPQLTDDRSRSTLGAEFGGQTGFFGGAAVAPDGSNINDVAYAILNAKLPEGSYVIPSPQIILPTGAGESVYSIPARFSENQGNVNLVHHFGSRDTLSAKYFFALTSDHVPFGGGASVPGFPGVDNGANHNLSISWNHVLNASWLNQARFAYTRLQELSDSEQPISAKSIGMNTPVTVTGMPNMGLLTTNLTFGALPPPTGSAVNNFEYADSLVWTHGRHTVYFGGHLEHTQTNVIFSFDQRAALRFFTFPDFLLGLSYPADGAPVPFGNIFVSSGRAGLINRASRSTDYAGFIQDNIAVTRRLEINAGIRYEIFGAVSDALGRLSNFDVADALPQPPATGTFTGYVIASNTIGSAPTGVLRRSSNTVLDTDYHDWAPRLGLAFRPFARNSNFVIRAGGGVYYSRPGNVINFESAANLPFAVISTRSAVSANFATLQNPFDPNLPTPDQFPIFLPRTPTTSIQVGSFNPKLTPPVVYQWSANVQYGFAQNYLLEIGYVGTRGTHLIGSYRFDQALLASPASPVNGITTNTVSNASLRAPIQGLNPLNSVLYTSAFDSNYNALEANLTRHFSHGLQFQTSYTWSHNIDNLPLGSLQAIGMLQGDVSNFRNARANADTDRPQRIVFNGYWRVPGYTGANKFLTGLASGWAFSGIATFQSGRPFSIMDTGGATIYGASGASYAELAPGATRETIQLGGSVESRLNGYFNTKGFTQTPTIGNGTGFGDSPRNLLRGPGQRDVDLSIIKITHIGHPTESANMEFRAEFFNAFNFVNFGQPSANFASPTTFGVISNTTVAPRIIQFALKYNF